MHCQPRYAMQRMSRAVLTIVLTGFFLSLWSQSGIIRGKVVDAFNRDPIPFATVQLEGTGTGEITDENGEFVLDGLEPGVYDLKISFLGYKEKYIYQLKVTNSQPAIIEVNLEAATENLQEVVVQASPFNKTEESPVSLRTIGTEEIKRSPGGNRDISRVIQSLPGVTSTVSFRNDLIIRGGAPNENRFYLDDVEVPNINHFATQGSSGGPAGIINVDFIREVDFYASAFPATEGNALSSIFNFKQKDGRNDRVGLTTTVGASDLGLTMEGPIGDKTTFIASARRSYLQFLFRALDLPFLPIYSDFQAKVKHKIDGKNEIYFVGLGAIDDFELNLDANKTEQQQFLLQVLPVQTQWNYTNGLVYKHYGKQGYSTFVLSRNMLDNQFEKYRDNDARSEDNLIIRYHSQEIENKFRFEHTSRYGDWKWTYGSGLEWVKYNNQTFNKIYTSSGAQDINYSSDLQFAKYAFFSQISRSWNNDRVTLSGGARLDGNGYSTLMQNPFRQFSPRIALSVGLTKSLFFNANTGIYYQLPPYTLLGYREGGLLINEATGKYIRNIHTVTGIEYNLNAHTKITLEGYYKWYENYPLLLRDNISLANIGGDFGIIGNEPALPDSRGKSYGLELLLQQRFYKGWYGILAYTLGKSEFSNADDVLVPSSWDARHIINLTGGKKFAGNWEMGVRWRFQTGIPYTPFSASSSLVENWDRNNSGIFDYARINTLRYDPVNTLDIRLDKQWFFSKWSLNLYLDVQNVFGNAVGRDQLILDRPLDADNTPVGPPVILNPDAPYSEQRYRVKSINDATGQVLPTIGIVIGI
ncbi:MAG TPA: TonB-dependent receptor [Saprospiraceae bacterium]|nr:TonB-dependent receptor [Saprospiraceae bacterium]